MKNRDRSKFKHNWRNQKGKLTKAKCTFVKLADILTAISLDSLVRSK